MRPLVIARSFGEAYEYIQRTGLKHPRIIINPYELETTNTSEFDVRIVYPVGAEMLKQIERIWARR